VLSIQNNAFYKDKFLLFIICVSLFLQKLSGELTNEFL